MNKKINREIQQIKEILIKKYKPEKIILFGSVSRGITHEGSDIDILIIKDSKKSFPDRIREVFDLTGSTLIEPLILTPKEIANRLTIKDFFFLRVLKEGQVLYEKTS